MEPQQQTPQVNSQSIASPAVTTITPPLSQAVTSAPAAPAQAVHQTATAAPQAVATVSPPTDPLASVTNRRAWSNIRQRSKKTAIIAAVITFLIVAPAMIYLIFKSHPTNPVKSNPIASIEVPADQLQKLSSDSINVATDRTLSFNTPLIVKRDLQVNGQTTLNNVKITGSLVFPTTTGVQANQTVAQSLSVVGTSLLQGDVTAKGSLNVGGNLNTGGSGSFAGNLSANQLSVKSSSLGNATIAHLITSGSTPSASVGNAAGAGSVTISGNDTAGTVTITTGAGALAQGDLVTVTFRTSFSSTPHVIVSPIGIETAAALSDVGGVFYASQSVSHLTIGASKMRLGVAGVAYTFSYFVAQ